VTWTSADVLTLLATHPFTSSLPDGVVARLAESARIVQVGAGEVVVREGEPGEDAYLVVGGRLVATVDGTVVGEIGRNETFGEMALLTGERRTATITVRRATTMVRIGASDFAQLLAEHPQAHRALATQLVQRLDRSQRGRLDCGEPALIGVTGARPATVGALAADLAEALRRSGTRADAMPVTDGLDLARIELDGPIALVHGTPAELDAHREELDRVLVVVDVATERPASSMPTLFDGTTTELVLAHPASCSLPAATTAWLRSTSVSDHHHIRVGRADDMDRLVRRLMGREYVLVLGGGGARGLAHLGTYRALVEAGVPIDAVAGVSAGSLFAAGIAMDRSPDEAEETSLELLVDAGSLVDLTIPAVALSSGRRITERIQHAFGADTEMEDLWRPMFCVSADLTTLAPVVHRTGPLWRAIRATVGVPGVFPPLVEGEAVLVDGGVIDNLPVQRARRLYPRATIIASDVGRRHEQLRHDLPDDGIVPGWRSAWSQVMRRRRTPGLVTLLYRLTALGSGGDPNARGDIHIEHRLDGIGMFDFPKARPAIRAGYEQTVAVLATAGWSAGFQDTRS
jgi:NTE family protein